MASNPEATVSEFFKAFNERDMETVLGLYEPEAVLVADPGQMASGTDALRSALERFFSMKPTLKIGKQRVVVASSLALSLANWTLTGTLPNGQPMEMSGTTSDVLRRQNDGRWLFAIDNPWGREIID